MKAKHKIVNVNHEFVDIDVECLDTTIEQQDLEQAFNFQNKSMFIDKDKLLPNLFNEEFDKLSGQFLVMKILFQLFTCQFLAGH